MTWFLRIFRGSLALWLCMSSFLLSADAPRKPPEFFVVIPSYNNCKWYEKNLESVFSQTYQNWKIYYVDDCSTDDTGTLVEHYVKSHGMSEKCTIVHNSERRGAMANLYYAIHQAAPTSVVVDLDGDDWLADETVLATLVQAYADPNIWLTYGSHQWWPDGRRGGTCALLPKEIEKGRLYRQYHWVTSALRTFYAKLFLSIKKEDLLYKGEFFPVSSDQGFMFPILEMASLGHTHFIEKILYIYNVSNPLNEFRNRREQEIEVEKYIRGLPPYDPIVDLFATEKNSDAEDSEPKDLKNHVITYLPG